MGVQIESSNAKSNVRNSMPIATTIATLAQAASVEVNVQDVDDLHASRAYLAQGTKLYVSHLPKQTWNATVSACASVRAAGFDPIPHVPVRLLKDAEDLHALFASLQQQAQIEEVLLIAGDYAQPTGPYASVKPVLKTFPLADYGIKRISFAGHPEGHPRVDRNTIRRAEIEKAQAAAELKLETTLLTQFFFAADPFIQWSNELRTEGVTANLVAGLAGPASLATLFKFALRCGVGPSLSALGQRPGSLFKLIGDYGPEPLIHELASSQINDPLFGFHFFCFGGFLRTCKWLHTVANGQFVDDEMKSSKGRL